MADHRDGDSRAVVAATNGGCPSNFAHTGVCKRAPLTTIGETTESGYIFITIP
jgi:hypothetical protein